MKEDILKLVCMNCGNSKTFSSPEAEHIWNTNMKCTKCEK